MPIPVTLLGLLAELCVYFHVDHKLMESTAQENVVSCACLWVKLSRKGKWKTVFSHCPKFHAVAILADSQCLVSSLCFKTKTEVFKSVKIHNY